MKALRADLLDFTGRPEWCQPSAAGVRWRPDHWLLIGDDGRIAGVQPGAQPLGPEWDCEDHRGRLLLPGFVDTHVHAAQLGVMGRWGGELLDWLERHTFPAELTWADPQRAAREAECFADALLAHGTTAAVVFPTVHKHSVDAVFAAAVARGMRMVSGKVLMDRHAPAALCDDVDQAERDCIDLIGRWHGQGRCSYAVTVRFAPTSSAAQLAMAGALCRADPTLYLQTHVAENREEVAWVASLFPEARSYVDVYRRHGLLHARSVLAHGIWLDAADRALLRGSGAQIAFCPSSNLFLGSGLFDWTAAHDARLVVTLASDVGGGTSLSQLRTAADAYRVQALAGARPTAFQLLHAATAGAAQALGLEHEIGCLDAGAAADVVLWDWTAGAAAGAPDAAAPTLAPEDLHARLFAWLMLGDGPGHGPGHGHRPLQTWVAGHKRFDRGC